MASIHMTRVSKGLEILKCWDGELELACRPGSHTTGVNPHGHGGEFAYLVVTIPMDQYADFLLSGRNETLREFGWRAEEDEQVWIYLC